MNSAIFKSMRESLGLDVMTMAMQTGFSANIIQGWEDGGINPPEEAVFYLEEIEELIGNKCQQTFTLIKEKRPDKLELKRYMTEQELHSQQPDFDGLPVAVYANYLYRLKTLLQREGITSSIVYKG